MSETKQHHRGWHWLPNDRMLRFGADRRVLGTYDTRSATGDLVLCRNGMHWSPRVIDALNYAQGSVICRVECWGDTIHRGDKSASEHRQIRWWVDAERVLWAWLCDEAERACNVAGVTDERSLGAIALRREWLGGRVVTDQEWDAARSAARDGARSAARSAAWDAQNKRLEIAIRNEAKRTQIANWEE